MKKNVFEMCTQVKRLGRGVHFVERRFRIHSVAMRRFVWSVRKHPGAARKLSVTVMRKEAT